MPARYQSKYLPLEVIYLVLMILSGSQRIEIFESSTFLGAGLVFSLLVFLIVASALFHLLYYVLNIGIGRLVVHLLRLLIWIIFLLSFFHFLLAPFFRHARLVF